MGQTKRKNMALVATVSGAALFVVLILIFSLGRNSDSGKLGTSSNPSDTNQATSTAPASQATVGSSATPTASATTSISSVPTDGVLALPESAKTILANFYTAFRNRDRERMGEMFSPDTTDEMRSLHATLFTGRDLNGVPGGPTLFESNATAEWVQEYTLLGAAHQNQNWVVTVREKRASSDANDTGTVTSLVTLTPAASGSGTWLIDQYIRVGSAGKYNGFFIQ